MPFMHQANQLLASYDRLLMRPFLMLLGVLLITLIALPGTRYFTFDASADTLVVQGDPELEFYRTVLARFGGDEFMLMILNPNDGDVLSQSTLALIARLEKKLTALDGVRNVLSILDAPLLRSPPIPITELAAGFKQLNSPGVDRALARAELSNSPLFKDLLISADGTVTALRIDLEVEHELEALRQERDRLRTADDSASQDKLTAVKANYAAVRADFLDRRAQLIDDVRRVRDQHVAQADLYIGGVPMVASDMIQFIKADIALFGVVVVLVMLLVLFGFFRQLTWVILPVVSAALSNTLLVGLLGYIGQAATVVSSNFVALLVITTVALNIHLIVRYRELVKLNPTQDHKLLVLETIHSKFAPCAYTALTTMVAFGSLLSSRILPVEDFGWIMVMGIGCSMFVTFTFFPALLLLFPPTDRNTKDAGRWLIAGLAKAAIKRPKSIFGLSIVITVVTMFGITLLSVDNRFIDYFREGTDIREGLLFVDKNLGGTIPFEVIVSFAPWQEDANDFAGSDDFADADDSNPSYSQKYWFTPDKMARLGKLHDYIDAHSATGKTLSLATLELIARDFNDNKPLDALLLVAILDAIPATLRDEFISPYAQPDAGLMRISSRIVESRPAFSRNDLIQDIEDYATTHLGFQEGEVHVTGVMVMFNDMIEQLVESQTSTIAYVIMAVLMMFLLLLRDWWLALIGLAPNILAAAAVLATMGYINLPLDMMTITIAAISVGIGVDNAIHYLYRYRLELQNHGPVDAITITHQAVGPAMYYTSVTVILGFSVLALSNFIPNVTFGLLTAVAMLLALLANLGIMPMLLLIFYRRPAATPS